MIMGDICTRACAFCNVAHRPAGRAGRGRAGAGRRRRRQARPRHVVITSVDRDDLADGGAAHFAATIRAIRAARAGDHDRGADAGFPAQGRRARNRHRRAARRLQPQSRDRALELSHESGPARAISIRCGCCSARRSSIPTMFTKSGIMVGLGEDAQRSAASDGRSALAPTSISSPSANISSRRRKHHPVLSFVTPDEFAAYATIGACQGLPAGFRDAADALLASRGRRFRPAEGRANGLEAASARFY